MTIHGSGGPTLSATGTGPVAGPEKSENQVHASLARIAEEFAGISDGQLSSGETPLVSKVELAGLILDRITGMLAPERAQQEEQQ